MGRRHKSGCTGAGNPQPKEPQRQTASMETAKRNKQGSRREAQLQRGAFPFTDHIHSTGGLRATLQHLRHLRHPQL